MKKFIALSALTFSLLPALASAASFRDVKAVDDLIVNEVRFDVTGRYVRGELDERIKEIHRVTITENGVAIRVRVLVNEDANHRALRRHADCALNPKTCKSQAVR